MKAKAKPRPGQPLEIKRGSVTVKIYCGTNRVGETVYDQYSVVFYDGTQRRKKRFAVLEEAKREAAFLAS